MSTEDTPFPRRIPDPGGHVHSDEALASFAGSKGDSWSPPARGNHRLAID
jgi:hypothetical protein